MVVSLDTGVLLSDTGCRHAHLLVPGGEIRLKWLEANVMWRQAAQTKAQEGLI